MVLLLFFQKKSSLDLSIIPFSPPKSKQIVVFFMYYFVFCDFPQFHISLFVQKRSTVSVIPF